MAQENNGCILFPLPGALFVLLVGLKLSNIIDWSWWWVCAPLIAPTVFLIIVFAIYGFAKVYADE